MNLDTINTDMLIEEYRSTYIQNMLMWLRPS